MPLLGNQHHSSGVLASTCYGNEARCESRGRGSAPKAEWSTVRCTAAQARQAQRTAVLPAILGHSHDLVCSMHRGQLLYCCYFVCLLTDGTPENYIMGSGCISCLDGSERKLMIDRHWFVTLFCKSPLGWYNKKRERERVQQHRQVTQVFCDVKLFLEFFTT